MSAKLPDNLPMRELIKHTGYEYDGTERACCCLSGKLRAWIRLSDGDMFYTHAEVPLVGEHYYYGMTELGHIGTGDITDEFVISSEQIQMPNGDIYTREAEADIDI